MPRTSPCAVPRLPMVCGCVLFFAAGFTGLGQAQSPTETALRLPLEMTWGHRSPAVHPFHVQLIAQELTLNSTRLEGGEAGDELKDGLPIARTRAGGGDVDGITCELRFEPRSIRPITNAQSIWTHLFQHGDPGATRRLKADPAFRPDSRKLTVALDETGTRGFSLTVDQLLTQRTFWLPELDVFVSADAPERQGGGALCAGLHGEP